MKNEMICICCPLGCVLNVTKNGSELVVDGNKCPRGKKYAIEEMIAPKRMVTTTVALIGGYYPVVSVKTANPVAKDKIFAIMQELDNVVVKVPVHVGDIILQNVATTGEDVVATCERL